MSPLWDKIESELLLLAAGRFSLQELTVWLGRNSVDVMSSGSELERRIVGEIEHQHSAALDSGDLYALIDAAREILSDLANRQGVAFKGTVTVDLGSTGESHLSTITGSGSVTRTGISHQVG